MKILVINTGSSSLKYQLFDMKDQTVLAGGLIERIGVEQSVLTHHTDDQGKRKTITQTRQVIDHTEALHLAVSQIIDPDLGVIKAVTQVDAVGHRVVQGGEQFKRATVIDAAVIDAIRKNCRLAPLHNPANLMGIQVAQQLFSNIPHIAVFDTQFHQTMPEKAFLYGLPLEYYERYHIRKYGFHGTSHQYAAQTAIKLMNITDRPSRLISLHLGNGCSICAVKDGQSIDTSMGMTPLSGIMMGSRSGDFDPAVFGYLRELAGMDSKKLEQTLNTDSGFKGICGFNDMRDIHEQQNKGNKAAQMAVEMFVYQIKKYIGAYAAAMNGLDALVFTAGIGENDPAIRSDICRDLSLFGILMDTEKNRLKKSRSFSIHSKSSRVQIWVVPANEELQIALETQNVLTTDIPGHPI